MKPFPMRLVLPALALPGLGFYAFHLPTLHDSVPIHWGWNGSVDATGPWWVPPLAFAVAPLLALLLEFAPRFDRRPENHLRHRSTYRTLQWMIGLFFTALSYLVIGATVGIHLPFPRIIIGGLGFLFIALGNYLPRLRPSSIVGIRTPWTLSNDRTWEKTHFLGGRVFILMGFMILLAALLTSPLAMTLTLSASLLIGPGFIMWYSWRVNRNAKRT